uniref:NADH dehydrogenase subunit 6 n=1 Tax=Euphaedusa planostriata TaxID=2798995 RepID=A0A7T7D6J3_9EUPU|nr:NADH dehydrogenase subunit 6 [Euphaedusa planostriata]QQL04598.1 NADH dehydrogenase subunit 6 [Euphaedusa planostriata]
MMLKVMMLSLCSLLVFIFFMSYFTSIKEPFGMFLLLLVSSLGGAVWLSVTFSFWYAALLLLIYVGGLLVLMLYIVMLDSNVQFIMKNRIPLLLFTIFALTTISSFEELNPFSISVFSTNNFGCNSSILLFLATYLLVVLFSLVNIMFWSTSSLKIEVM